jgi:hypothetical protein
MAKCSCSLHKKESWSAFQPKRKPESQSGFFGERDRRNSGATKVAVNGSHNAAIYRCSDFERSASSAGADGCDYKRSAVSSVLSGGEAGTLLPKICVLETIFSSCFMILAMSAGFLNPSGSSVSSATTVNRKS